VDHLIHDVTGDHDPTINTHHRGIITWSHDDLRASYDLGKDSLHKCGFTIIS
jgi:hypothetical protein